MAHTCPWWFTYAFDNPLRRLFQPPERTLEPVVWEDQRVLDLGCGMGYFAVAAARMVGPDGRVLAVDLQQKSLNTLGRRAEKAGLADRIRLHHQDAAELALPGPIDAAYAIWTLHEMRPLEAVAERLGSLLPTDARLLVAEPKIHVSERGFGRILATLRDAGFVPGQRVKVGLSRALVLVAP
jgi:precorrin-6B methylase 2